MELPVVVVSVGVVEVGPKVLPGRDKKFALTKNLRIYFVVNYMITKHSQTHTDIVWMCTGFWKRKQVDLYQFASTVNCAVKLCHDTCDLSQSGENIVV